MKILPSSFKEYAHILNSLPVTINDCYGDPLFPKQFPNTLQKIKELKGRPGPTTIITKGVITDSQIDILRPHIWNSFVIIYTLTGMDEGNISFDERLKTISRLNKICNRIIILCRPIIPVKNDQICLIKKIIDVASNYSNIFIYGGLKNKNGFGYKKISPKLEIEILKYIEKKKVKIYSKSSCAIAHLLKCQCYSHFDSCSPNLSGISLLKYLGYKIQTYNGRIFLRQGTEGDCNFIRFVCNSIPFIEKIKKTNILSMSSDKIIFEATSSYFIWSKNLLYCLGCDYCLINDFSHLKGKEFEIGCNPLNLLTLIYE